MRCESVVVLRYPGSSWDPPLCGAGDNEALEFLLMNRLIYGLPPHPGVFGFMEWGANMRDYSVERSPKSKREMGKVRRKRVEAVPSLLPPSHSLTLARPRTSSGGLAWQYVVKCGHGSFLSPMRVTPRTHAFPRSSTMLEANTLWACRLSISP